MHSETITDALIIRAETSFYASQKRKDNSSLGYLAGLWANYRAVEYFRDRVISKIPESPRIEWLTTSLAHIRILLANQIRIHHAPAPLADFLFGLGWCDQINAIAARVLSKYASAAEVFSLRDELGQSNHTVARLLFPGYPKWIYVDIWSRSVVVFEKDFGQTTKFLRVLSLDAKRATLDLTYLQNLYDSQIDRGFVLSDIQPTFTSQLTGKILTKIKRSIGRSSYEFSRVDPPTTNQSQLILYSDFDALSSPAYAAIPSGLESAYFAARLSLIKGDFIASEANFEKLERSLQDDSNLNSNQRAKDVIDLMQHRAEILRDRGVAAF